MLIYSKAINDVSGLLMQHIKDPMKNAAGTDTVGVNSTVITFTEKLTAVRTIPKRLLLREVCM
jgi:hypothetical protein